MLIEEVINHLQVNLTQTDITLYNGAADDLITTFEQTSKVRLPNDIKCFYKFANGFESDEDIFRIVPLEEILEYRKNHAHGIIIAEYMTYCDMWYLEVNLFNHNDYCIFYVGADHKKLKLTDSFAEFLNRFLKGGVFETGGLYDWTDELRLKGK